MNYEIDSLDKQILRELRKDSRKPYLEIARELKVSGGTIHVRVNKLKEAGVIKGAMTVINYKALGYSVSALVGIQLSKASDCDKVTAHLVNIPEIIEIHYTTGNYSLLIKALAKNIDDLYALLSRRLQNITGIQSTETFIVLNTYLDRDVDF